MKKEVSKEQYYALKELELPGYKLEMECRYFVTDGVPGAPLSSAPQGYGPIKLRGLRKDERRLPSMVLGFRDSWVARGRHMLQEHLAAAESLFGWLKSIGANRATSRDMANALHVRLGIGTSRASYLVGCMLENGVLGIEVRDD